MFKGFNDALTLDEMVFCVDTNQSINQSIDAAYLEFVFACLQILLFKTLIAKL